MLHIDPTVWVCVWVVYVWGQGHVRHVCDVIVLCIVCVLCMFHVCNVGCGVRVWYVCCVLCCVTCVPHVPCARHACV